MSNPKDIERLYALTNVVDVPGDTLDRVYWFGRVDRKDQMRPIKIVATNASLAWQALDVHYSAAFFDGGEKRRIYECFIQEMLVKNGMVQKDFDATGPDLLLALSDLVEHYNELKHRMDGLEK